MYVLDVNIFFNFWLLDSIFLKYIIFSILESKSCNFYLIAIPSDYNFVTKKHVSQFSESNFQKSHFLPQNRADLCQYSQFPHTHNILG